MKAWEKLKSATCRYGMLHTLCSVVGRRSAIFWRLAGPLVTKRYLDDWLMADGTKILNLGGGGLLSGEMLSADISPRADVYLDITRPFPVPAGSIDHIFCEEVIEHVGVPSAAHMLRECCRVLRPGGQLRLSTPDLSFFVRMLDKDSGPVINPFLRSEAEKVKGDVDLGVDGENLCLLNWIFYHHEHRFIWREETLFQLLSRVGFEQIRRSEFGDPGSILGRFDSHAQRYGHPAEMSLILECKKPQSSTLVNGTQDQSGE